jgi:hypothetical protein
MSAKRKKKDLLPSFLTCYEGRRRNQLVIPNTTVRSILKMKEIMHATEQTNEIHA